MIKNKENIIVFFKFSLVGIVGVAVNYAFLFVFDKIFHFYYLIAAGLAIEISIISNFILNHIWTFKDRKRGNILNRLFQFNLFCAGGILINLLILRYFKEVVGFNLYFSEFFGILGGFLWNFLFSNFFVWGNKDSFNKEKGKIQKKKVS